MDPFFFFFVIIAHMYSYFNLCCHDLTVSWLQAARGRHDRRDEEEEGGEQLNCRAGGGSWGSDAAGFHRL